MIHFLIMVRLIALLFFLGVICCEPLIAQAKKQVKQGNESARNHETDKRGTPDSPLVINTRTVKSDSEAAEEHDKDSEQKRVNRWTIGLTLVLAICALLQFLAIIGQILIYKRQTGLMEQSLAETHKSNKIIKEIADGSTESSRRVDRAYILPKISPLANYTNQVVDGWHTKVAWENVGKTPAIRVQVHLGEPILKNDDFMSDGECLYDPGVEGSCFDIPPDRPGISFTRGLKLYELLAAQGGRFNIFVWGWCEYSDVFADFPRHRTEFCVKISPMNDVSTPSIVFAIRSTGSHNGMDTTCFYEAKTDPYRKAPYSYHPKV